MEIYGLYRALRALRLWLVGVRNLVVEVDARYIKGMLANPDIVPSASINRWIMSILTFHFSLVHVPGERHAPDGLSRRSPQEGDEPRDDSEDYDEWLDNLYAFVAELIPAPRLGDAPAREEPFAPEARMVGKLSPSAPARRRRFSRSAAASISDMPSTIPPSSMKLCHTLSAISPAAASFATSA